MALLHPLSSAHSTTALLSFLESIFASFFAFGNKQSKSCIKCRNRATTPRLVRRSVFSFLLIPVCSGSTPFFAGLNRAPFSTTVPNCPWYPSSNSSSESDATSPASPSKTFVLSTCLCLLFRCSSRILFSASSWARSACRSCLRFLFFIFCGRDRETEQARARDE